jgi:hypothetical protein
MTMRSSRQKGGEYLYGWPNMVVFVYLRFLSENVTVRHICVPQEFSGARIGNIRGSSV